MTTKLHYAETRREPQRLRCHARAKQTGIQCASNAMHGQKVCQMHGGKSPQALRKAELRNFSKDLVVIGNGQRKIDLTRPPKEIDPQQALLEMVWKSSAIVSILEDMVTTPDALVTQWGDLYAAERDRLSRISKLSIDAGISERHVRVAEFQAAVLARVVVQVLSDPRMRLSEVQVRNGKRLAAWHLRRMAGSQIETEEK
jgi:hypothetical protein